MRSLSRSAKDDLQRRDQRRAWLNESGGKCRSLGPPGPPENIRILLHNRPRRMDDDTSEYTPKESPYLTF